MDSTRFGTRERSVRWLASAGVGVAVSLLLTGSRAGLAAAAAMLLGVHTVGCQRLARGSAGIPSNWMPWPVPGKSAGGSQADLRVHGLVRATGLATGIIDSIRRGGVIHACEC